MERDPLPDAGPWRGIADRDERLRTGLASIYGWYERNAERVACVLRDADYHALTREMNEMRVGPHFAAYHEALGVKLTVKQRAMLELALSFYTWRTLVHDGGMKTPAAVETMVQAIDCAK
jgi:hypothetical protein